MSPDYEMIQELIAAKQRLSATAEALRVNAQQIEQATLSDDEDVTDCLQAMMKGLNDLCALIQQRLPSNQSEGLALKDELGPRDWTRFERTFVHDLRNPLGVVLGYSEIFDETLEELEEELEEENSSPWLPYVRQHLSALSEQLQLFNQSLDHLFPQRQAATSHQPRIQTIIPLNDTPTLDSDQEHDDVLGEVIDVALTEETSSASPQHSNEGSLNSPLLNEMIAEPKAQPSAEQSAVSSPYAQNKERSREVFKQMKSAKEALFKEARVLIVDDNKSNRDLLSSMLRREGLKSDSVASAYEAKQRLEMADYDLILLDLVMPEVGGDELLQELKFNSPWQRIPVLMISGDTELETAIRCIELGAEDFLQKPFNRVLLKARIGASIEKKRLSDEMEDQNKRFKVLLNRILPEPVVRRLDDGESMIADRFESTTILFSDLVGFTKMSSTMSPTELILTLDEVFSAFDEIAERFGVEKIKTIGDAYMAAAGLPIPRDDHADAVVLMGIEMIHALNEIRQRRDLPLHMRVGIHSGPVAAGIIGQKRFLYDVWGDTVNLASRLEASGAANHVHISFDTYRQLRDRYEIRPTGGLELKGKGFVETFLIEPDLTRSKFKPLI